jgi:type II secretory pathway pseudopilin PulG
MKFLPSCLVALFGLGLALADPTKDDPQDEAKIKLAKTQIRTLTQAAETYRLNNGDWPPNLKVLTEKQPNGGAALLEVKALTDPWKKAYQYDEAGNKNKGLRPDIWTETPDKKIIGNWPEEKK